MDSAEEHSNRIIPGMLIKTNYSGPYRVKSITRGCTCRPYSMTLNFPGDKEPWAPHLHLVLSGPDGKGEYYLSHYDEETLIDNGVPNHPDNDGPEYDWIEILPDDEPVQEILF